MSRDSVRRNLLDLIGNVVITLQEKLDGIKYELALFGGAAAWLVHQTKRIPDNFNISINVHHNEVVKVLERLKIDYDRTYQPFFYKTSIHVCNFPVRLVVAKPRYSSAKGNVHAEYLSSLLDIPQHRVVLINLGGKYQCHFSAPFMFAWSHEWTRQTMCRGMVYHLKTSSTRILRAVQDGYKVSDEIRHLGLPAEVGLNINYLVERGLIKTKYGVFAWEEIPEFVSKLTLMGANDA